MFYSGTRLKKLWLSVLDQAGPIITFLTASTILYTRSIGVIYYSGGAIGCALSVKIIKLLVRQPRPPIIVERKAKKSYGMPSTHSASISYLATYTLLASLYLPLHPSLHGVVNARFTPMVVIPWAISVTMSRVWLGHHTWPQVFAGASYGMTFAWLWFKLWMAGLNTKILPLETVINAWIDDLLVQS